MTSSTTSARLFVTLQKLLPRYWMTRIVYRLARIRVPAVKNFLIRRFVAAYAVDISEACHAVPDGYATFNDFFTRELRDNARPVDPAGDSLCSPVDGTLSASGDIREGQLFQAKGKSYSLTDLLAVDVDDARVFADGSFATIYLAPYNYHRVHAPFDGRLTGMHYVPGDLYSVNRATVQFLPGLFARNERLVCHFRTPHGPAAVILVGALNVGSITTPWTGEIRPRSDGMVETLPVSDDAAAELARGDLLGWFNMGSTVILLLPPGTTAWDESLAEGRSLYVGQRIGRFGPSI